MNERGGEREGRGEMEKEKKQREKEESICIVDLVGERTRDEERENKVNG